MRSSGEGGTHCVSPVKLLLSGECEGPGRREGRRVLVMLLQPAPVGRRFPVAGIYLGRR